MAASPLPLDLRGADLGQVRAAIRAGRHDRHTAGLAPGRLQCNLVILPQADATDFLRFCELNPRPCPVAGVSAPGAPFIPALGADMDLRRDVPRYRVHAHGETVAEPTDITDLWRDDLVAVALGCSFTFERALAAAGIAMRHVDEDRTVPMYRTSLPCAPAGAFAGDLVVSMRPLAPADVARATEICARYPHAHGAPVHVGDPGAIGIADLGAPDYGDAVTVRPDETPVFWACGVTPQNVLARARPAFCITHAPGHMLITDLDEAA